MASITASRGVASITPPSSSHGHRDWEYSVPIDAPEDDGNTYYSYTGNRNGGASRSRTSSVTKPKGVENRKPSYNRSNSDYARDTPRNAYLSNAAEISQDDFLVAPRAPALSSRSPSSADGRDSVIDLYSNNRLSTISGVTEILPNINSSATAMYDLSGDIDNREASSWIHRDKLMRIESVEFKKTPTSSEAWVKTASRKLSLGRMSEARGNSNSQAWENSFERSGEEDSGVFDDNDFDLRLPEEREAAREAELIAQKLAAARNKSNTPSKIPVNVASPAPIPLQFLERNSPLKRARSGSIDEDEVQSISYPATRTRSQTLESEDPPVTPPEKSAPGTANSSTPPNRTTRSLSKSSPRRPSSSHRASAAGGKNLPKLRTASASGNRGSGGSGSASINAAPQHKSPEGQPPWAVASYAPDPKLPQDQQIIPTVAKRLQQEEWEREGAPASVFDRDLRPLKLYEKDIEPKEAINFGEQSAQWPISNEKQRDPPPMVEPKKEIPKMESPKILPKAPRSESPPPRPPSREPIRVKDPDEVPTKGKKDKGCCGCSIM
ncbi:hypothetical protein AOL_s00006g223 [Orbilia oligospora ATCC 24927]|uniref:TeaA receptor TeaR n=2 Tax=Orbilia oligospora TaxID=2813651 RepID=G1X022_ARTOA|nr:hypothetical protein AOL_s00006g223 [Orbilia oligospora ATCC 24927]EGX53357.1 hypothetical protein AOL_s00006g223 [Orbilia oligospora ATCC 24927]